MAGNIEIKVSVTIPTLNESGNVEKMFYSVKEVLSGHNFEVIFVDDESSDGTPSEIKSLQKKHDNIVLLERKGKTGLASAAADGFGISKGAYLCLVDADQSYDITILPEMVNLLNGDYDIVLGSRYLKSSNTSGFAPHRKFISLVARAISSFNIKHKLADPGTGYAMVKREYFNNIRHRMKLIGFKFPYEILAYNPNAKVVELETYFIDRTIGASKFNMRQIFYYLQLVIFVFWERLFPTRINGDHA